MGVNIVYAELIKRSKFAVLYLAYLVPKPEQINILYKTAYKDFRDDQKRNKTEHQGLILYDHALSSLQPEAHLSHHLVMIHGKVDLVSYRL